ncbi:uncharacterized protein LOC110460360 [Mizuhopecten yessoensis]|uniref:Uncharacterized protein n=1 Tax=Mizuhopecten yessoensis TaxID=6573 RepID=A0A210Q2M2_MIZYE|nr:uncharacterized protein LOC110460360 [Mizuhopecten yessoensis]OWF42991.1 hypothetical protein KP79_PYT01962 [Mizuhopecten yessoensis]
MGVTTNLLLCLISCSLYISLAHGQRIPFIRYLRTGGGGYPVMERVYLKSSGRDREPEPEAKCGKPMDSCIPDVTECCNNMQCLNKAHSYCLYPLEMCLCISPTSHNVDML